ncbi:MAG TPA: Stp1/IreP family PP2C-type Ser/Thr phosphatase [Firmicutes bacterium]|nr:Stp1/IreP family PP2C-type Ser/Thr phosphatase [Bacillota bacterium]
MRLGARSDIGRMRQVNEDSFLAGEGLIAVADGMGGHQAGEVASRMACERLGEMLPVWPHDPAGWLLSVFSDINSRIYNMSLANPSCAGMGTTLTAAVFLEREMYVGHVGDSRAYMLRGGQLKRITDDHSVVGELVRSGSLTEEEARFHPRRNIITRAVGVEPVLVPDVIQVSIAPGDYIILCTDGLTEMVDDTEILGVMMSSDSPQAGADSLVRLANERGGHDNITVVIAHVA